MTYNKKKTKYVIDNIERTKKIAKCSYSNNEVKIKLKLIIFITNCNKSRLILTFLIVRIVQILYYNKFKFTCFFFVYR